MIALKNLYYKIFPQKPPIYYIQHPLDEDLFVWGSMGGAITYESIHTAKKFNSEEEALEYIIDHTYLDFILPIKIVKK